MNAIKQKEQNQDCSALCFFYAHGNQFRPGNFTRDVQKFSID